MLANCLLSMNMKDVNVNVMDTQEDGGTVTDSVAVAVAVGQSQRRVRSP